MKKSNFIRTTDKLTEILLLLLILPLYILKGVWAVVWFFVKLVAHAMVIVYYCIMVIVRFIVIIFTEFR